MSLKSMQLSFLRSTVRKWIIEIRENPKEGIAGLLKFGALFSPGHDTEDLLREVKIQLADEGSAYHQLIENLARQVEVEPLSVFGLNLGYHALSAGKKQIRSIEATEGFHVPWCLSIHVGGETQHLSPPLLARLLAQGQSLGIHCYYITLAASYPAFDELLSVLRRAEDCACILFLSPEMLTAQRAAQLSTLPNLLLLLDLDTGEEDALTAAIALMRGRLCGGFTRYTRLEDEAQGALSRASALGLLILALLDSSPDSLAESGNIAYLETLRRSLPGPVFPIDLVWDIARIDRAISQKAFLVSISAEGTLSYHDETRGDQETALRISETELKEIFRAALPM